MRVWEGACLAVAMEERVAHEGEEEHGQAVGTLAEVGQVASHPRAPRRGRARVSQVASHPARERFPFTRCGGCAVAAHSDEPHACASELGGKRRDAKPHHLWVFWTLPEDTVPHDNQLWVSW